MDKPEFVSGELRKMGWTMVRVWEHDLSTPGKVAGKIKGLFLLQKEIYVFS
jgi:G:T-mismatch repair DNA endonuclease (very short patch repair protein)